MINRPKPSGIAVDFGGTKISAARVVEGRIAKIIRIETKKDAPVSDQINTICDLVRQLGDQPKDPIGVAVAGRVSADGQWYAVNTDILTRINKVPLRQLLVRELGREVVIENDAIAAAQGEYACGAAMGYKTFAYITISTGVGGGIILNGKPVVSSSGLAGHIGFTTSRLAGGDCGSGRSNTVESIASGRALAARAAENGHPGLSGKDVFDKHLAGVDWASQLVSLSAATISELAINLKVMLDIEAVVIGGGVGLAKGYTDLVASHLQTEPELFRPQIHPAQLGENSALVGVLV